MSTTPVDALQLYALGREKMASGDLEAAIELFERSLLLNPHFKTLELLGECYVSVGHLRRAVVPLAAATCLNEQVRAPALLADVLLRLAENETALRIARVALQRSPGSKIALQVLEKLGAVTDNDG